jgi:hypothetical protein
MSVRHRIGSRIAAACTGGRTSASTGTAMTPTPTARPSPGHDGRGQGHDEERHGVVELRHVHRLPHPVRLHPAPFGHFQRRGVNREAGPRFAQGGVMA